MPRPPAPAGAQPPAPGYDAAAGLLGAFAASERVNQYLLEHLDDAAWRAAAPAAARPGRPEARPGPRAA
jgi:hypothetical protein